MRTPIVNLWLDQKEKIVLFLDKLAIEHQALAESKFDEKEGSCGKVNIAKLLGEKTKIED